MYHRLAANDLVQIAAAVSSLAALTTPAATAPGAAGTPSIAVQTGSPNNGGPTTVVLIQSVTVTSVAQNPTGRSDAPRDGSRLKSYVGFIALLLVLATAVVIS